MTASCDLAIVGAGAAGLMAAIQAGRARPGLRVVALDGARTLGAKILVSGGGRCNVTHHEVAASDFAGSSPHAIARVLRAFDVAATVRFFAGLGVGLEREATGKLFPVDDSARTVLRALLAAAQEAGVTLAFPRRVTVIERREDGFRVAGPWGELAAARVVLAAGGRSLPRSGSDGSGYALATALGHSVTPVFPALVPLLLPADDPLLGLAGVALPVRLEVRGATGARRVRVAGPLLCTHFGVSGPAVLDVSRHLLAARRGDPGARLHASFLPGATPEALDGALRSLGGRSAARWLGERLPERLAVTLAAIAGIDPATPGHRLARDARRRLVATLLEHELRVVGDRGWTHAEVTAGGVPLAEVDTATMASRRVPGLHLVGEILDVDGRIGGFNFQWAWASGTVAGRAAAQTLPGDGGRARAV